MWLFPNSFLCCSEDFVLRSVTLSTRNVLQRHTGLVIYDEYMKCAEEFHISSKVICCVTDAGSNVKRAVSLASVSNHLCLGHGLHNLVLRDGFGNVQELHDLLVKCRTLVQKLHYKASQLEQIAEADVQMNLLQFVSLGEELEDDENDPVLDPANDDHSYASLGTLRQTKSVKGDTPTRWHSILKMFDSLVENRRYIRTLLDPSSEGICITPEEWAIMRDLSEFLKTLQSSVELLSQEKSCTFNLILIVRSVLLECLEERDEDHVLVQEMKRCMRSKFDHRFPMSDTVVAASLLDPRFQHLRVVDDYLDVKGVDKVDFLVKQTLDHIKECNVTERVSASNTASESSTSLEQLAVRHSTSTVDMSTSVRVECHSLLGLPNTVPEGDVLGFWRRVAEQYPWLSRLAKKLLCIPATSTPSERVFSVAGQVLRAKRSRLHPLTVDKVIFIHDNYSVSKQ